MHLVLIALDLEHQYSHTTTHDQPLLEPAAAASPEAGCETILLLLTKSRSLFVFRICSGRIVSHVIVLVNRSLPENLQGNNVRH